MKPQPWTLFECCSKISSECNEQWYQSVTPNSNAIFQNPTLQKWYHSPEIFGTKFPHKSLAKDLSQVPDRRATLLYMGDSSTALARVPTAPVQPAMSRNKFPKPTKTGEITIGPKFVKNFMPWFEHFWHTYKRYPSNADIAQQFGFTNEQIALMHGSKFWQLSCQRRGIRIDNPNKLNDAPRLSDRQIAAIAIITNFSDRRSPVARLQGAGITEEELNGWYSDPLFKEELARRAEDAFDNVAPVAQANLARLIQSGNLNAIKFYFEVTGKAQTPEAINLKRTIQFLVEAVQKHVKDPEVLKAIAEEVNAVRGIEGL